MVQSVGKPVTKAELIEVVAKLDDGWKKWFSGFTKEFGEFVGTVMNTLDTQTIILKRLDQERLFTIERVKRIEADIEVLKKHVGLVS